MTKITKREMFNAIANAMATGEWTVSAEEVQAFCEKEVAALDAKAIKAKERSAAKRAETNALREIVKAALTNEPQTLADLAVVVAETDPDTTTSKVVYQLTSLVKDGIAVKSDVKISATETSKARTVKAYALA